MKVFNFVIGFLCVISFIIVILFTSIEGVIYFNNGYFEKEYKKYNVLKDVDMEMSDVLYVTEGMLDYLKDKRDDLDITTTIGNEKRKFFNEKEITHMKDVKNLFMRAINIRKICIVIILVSTTVLIGIKSNWKYILSRSFQIVSLIFILITGVLGIFVSMNFTKYFTIFHEMFFDNDLWLLDPATDLLINIVPEPFFFDTALRIGILFFSIITFVFIICTVYLMKYKLKVKR